MSLRAKCKKVMSVSKEDGYSWGIKMIMRTQLLDVCSSRRDAESHVTHFQKPTWETIKMIALTRFRRVHINYTYTCNCTTNDNCTEQHSKMHFMVHTGSSNPRRCASPSPFLTWLQPCIYTYMYLVRSKTESLRDNLVLSYDQFQL